MKDGRVMTVSDHNHVGVEKLQGRLLVELSRYLPPIYMRSDAKSKGANFWSNFD